MGAFEVRAEILIPARPREGDHVGARRQRGGEVLVFHPEEEVVHAERLVGHLVATPDLVGQRFWRALRQAGDDSEPARIAHRGRQFEACNFGSHRGRQYRRFNIQ